MTYKTISKASMHVKKDKPKGQRLKLSNMSSFPGLLKGIAIMGVYLVGFTYLTMNLNLEDRFFQTMTQKDEEYTKKVKLDPFYHDFFIMNVMRYFGISDRLMKKTELELKQKLESNEAKVEQGGVVKFEKQMIEFVQSFGGKK